MKKMNEANNAATRARMIHIHHIIVPRSAFGIIVTLE